jgi:hypothetical protein
MIKAGDMVMIVRCCSPAYYHGLGKVFTVRSVEQVTPEFLCGGCENKVCLPTAFANALFEDPREGISMSPVAWLLRVDPPAAMRDEALASSRPVLACDGGV